MNIDENDWKLCVPEDDMQHGVCSETQDLLQLFTEPLMSHCRRTYNGMFKPCLAYTKLKPYSLSLSEEHV